MILTYDPALASRRTPSLREAFSLNLNPAHLDGGGLRRPHCDSQPLPNAPLGSVTCLGQQPQALTQVMGACSATFQDNMNKHWAPPCQPPQALSSLVTPGEAQPGTRSLLPTHKPASSAFQQTSACHRKDESPFCFQTMSGCPPSSQELP